MKGMIKMVFYNMLKRMVLAENYNSKEEMKAKIEKFSSDGRITDTQKAELLRLLGE